jgi:uncharacterized membrane protein YhfC
MQFLPLLISGLLMVAIGVASVALWRRLSQTRGGWFAIGAGLWFGSVVVKIFLAWLMNEPVLAFLEARLPRAAYLVAGGAYIGMLSAVCEIGAVIATAFFWRHLASGRDRAVAIGVGAGGLEAILVGAATIMYAVVIMFGGSRFPELRAQLLASLDTKAAWLVGPVERVIALLCHVSSRLLVLMAFATGRRALAGWGFLLFALLDSIAGFAHISGLLDGSISAWWIELMFAPLAVASVFILRWSYPRYVT